MEKVEELLHYFGMKTKKWWAALLPFLAIALWAGCGKASAPKCDSSATPCSCDKSATTSKSCDDREGMEVATAQKDCTSGTFSSAARCPTASRVGTCKITVATSVTLTRYYSDAVTAQAACEAVKLSTGLTGTVEWVSN